jgi:hypothetical protein
MQLDPIFPFMPGNQSEEFVRLNGRADCIGAISDGYHTFQELYDHRCILFVYLLTSWPDTWCSKLHDDGTMFEDYFIAGAVLPTGTITYHLHVKYWKTVERVVARVLPNAPKWDGHTPRDVVRRLESYLGVL